MAISEILYNLMNNMEVMEYIHIGMNTWSAFLHSTVLSIISLGFPSFQEIQKRLNAFDTLG